MAIQNRRGAYSNFAPSKMVPGEFAVVQSGDPNGRDGQAVYIAFNAGQAKRLSTYEDMQSEIESATEDIAQDLTDQIEAEVADDLAAAQTAATNAQTAATTATTKATEAAASATQAAQTVANIIDNTLTQTGKAADAKKVGDELADVKSDLNTITGAAVITGWIKGKRIATGSSPVNYGSPTSTSLHYVCLVADCNDGDVFTITGQNNNTGYALFCWCSEDGTIIYRRVETLNLYRSPIIAPTGAKKLIINASYDYDYELIKGRFVSDEITALQDTTFKIGNILDNYRKNGSSHVGITYTWDGDVCHISGTSTNSSIHNIADDASGLYNGFEAGASYRIIFDSENVAVRVLSYSSSGTLTTVYSKSGQRNDVFAIPNDAAHIIVRFIISSGVTVNEYVTPYIIKERTALSKYVSRVAIDAEQSNGNSDILSFITMKDGTSNGLTYTWDAFNNSCAVSGTTTGLSFNRLYLNQTALPNGIIPGGTYRAFCDSENILLRIVWYDGEGADAVLAETGGTDSIVFTVPSNAVGLSIRINVHATGVTVNETVRPHIYKELDDAEKKLNRNMIGAASELEAGNVSVNAHLLAVGNSFMRGAVYTNGHMDHLSAYENTVYGNIAFSLSVPNANVDNVLHSSSGIIKPNDGKNLVDIIKTTDLSGYDYLITGMSGSDMGASYPLGSLESTAGDGTIAGAVMDLVNYINTSNGKCKLILLSVPPYSSDTDKSGAVTFTGVYGNGKSLTDLDKLLYALAEQYHFTVVSWQDNPMSYHYMDFADYIGPNQGSRHANSESTYRAMGEYAALQIKAVNSPLALKMIMGNT